MSAQESLQAIYDQQGKLTPAPVVEVAKDPEHPLHSRFDWNDDSAAEKYRLVQAGYIIRSVRVTVERSDQSTVTVRPWIARESLEPHREKVPATGQAAPETVGEYVPVTVVASDDVMRSAWFRSLERDWRILKKRAGTNREFADMVLADVRDVAR